LSVFIFEAVEPNETKLGRNDFYEKLEKTV
jgi:hypothetical protein